MRVVGADQGVCDVVWGARGVDRTPFLQELLDIFVVVENDDIGGTEFEADYGAVCLRPVAEPGGISSWA